MQSNVTIVIPTLHRKESLKRLLKNLAETVHFYGEIIVVEQHENNATDIIRYSKQLHLHLSYIYMKTPSTPRAMNLGAYRAKNSYILFLDDDVLGTEGFIEQHLNNFHTESVAATVGRCVTMGQKLQSTFSKTGHINWLGKFSDGFSSTLKQDVDTVIGCNTCWRKDVYMKLGGMDEHFTGNALRLESDLSLRAKKIGLRIIFEPLAEVKHLREASGGARKTEGRLQWYFDFFSNETYFFLKHFSLWLLPIFLLSKISWVLRCMFGFGREVSIRSLRTPGSGIMDGLQKYYNTKYDHRS